MSQPAHLRLRPEEEEQIERVRAALSQKLSGAPVTKSQAMHVMLAKGYEVFFVELGLERAKK